MSKRILVAFFEREEDAVGAVHAMRGKGLKILDAFSPCVSEELIHAVGIKPTRLVWACFIFGLLGVGLMTLFQFWTSVVDWPIDVGGKPWNSLPAYTPVIFEMMVLFGGLGVVFSLFAVCKMYPGKAVKMLSPEATDDRFSVVMEHCGAAYKIDEIKASLDEFHMLELAEHIDEGGHK